LLVAAFLVSSLPAMAQDQAAKGTGAVLRALDKLNGKTTDLQLSSGQSEHVFGLDVDMIECRYPLENPTGDAYAYLQIRDSGQTEMKFEGWMIASSPALNALDHSRYDIWVLRCIIS
jgi:hypothetical protein